MLQRRPSVYVFYHYFPPDDVVSAVHFGDLAAGLAERGWEVTAFPCCWACRDETLRFPRSEQWNNVSIRRRWRPRFRQSSGAGRLMNALWMAASWSLLALRPGRGPDVLIVGTDPIMSLVCANWWRIFRPRTRIAHWCFDLYPEAAVADGVIAPRGLLHRLLSAAMGLAYRACSLIVDIGPCMRDLLVRYRSRAKRETITPWALDEPTAASAVDAREQQRIFGDARLALLYSGTLGRAHPYDDILHLAQLLEPRAIKVAFSVRGNRESDLRSAIQERKLAVPMLPFASAAELATRLACADVHIVALRTEWTGTVVPSKFFGALAAGRPVLFSGSPQSSVARWIAEYGVGWILERNTLDRTAEELIEYADSPSRQQQMRRHCFAVYREQFSKAVQIERWNDNLRLPISDASD